MPHSPRGAGRACCIQRTCTATILVPLSSCYATHACLCYNRPTSCRHAGRRRRLGVGRYGNSSAFPSPIRMVPPQEHPGVAADSLVVHPWTTGSRPGRDSAVSHGLRPDHLSGQTAADGPHPSRAGALTRDATISPHRMADQPCAAAGPGLGIAALPGNGTVG